MGWGGSYGARASGPPHRCHGGRGRDADGARTSARGRAASPAVPPGRLLRPLGMGLSDSLTKPGPARNQPGRPASPRTEPTARGIAGWGVGAPQPGRSRCARSQHTRPRSACPGLPGPWHASGLRVQDSDTGPAARPHGPRATPRISARSVRDMHMARRSRPRIRVVVPPGRPQSRWRPA